MDVKKYWCRLETQKSDCKVVLGTKSFHKNKQQTVRCCSEIGQGVGLRQGFPLSPILLNIYIQHVINERLADIQERVKVEGVLIQSIRFAGDQAMVSHTQCGLQRIGLMDAVQQRSEKYNMLKNVKKTKVMRLPGRRVGN